MYWPTGRYDIVLLFPSTLLLLIPRIEILGFRRDSHGPFVLETYQDRVSARIARCSKVQTYRKPIEIQPVLSHVYTLDIIDLVPSAGLFLFIQELFVWFTN